ncbi:MAG: hypothetical protein Q4D50_00675 [Eubacteriales bacterium]|nr:hypothetical protein [Eubacteriales bacterium]
MANHHKPEAPSGGAFFIKMKHFYKETVLHGKGAAVSLHPVFFLPLAKMKNLFMAPQVR